MPNPENLSRTGPGRTAHPRIYVGCVPCAQRLIVRDIEHANIWLENHWKRCKRTLRDDGGNLLYSASGRLQVAPRLGRGAKAESRV